MTAVTAAVGSQVRRPPGYSTEPGPAQTSDPARTRARGSRPRTTARPMPEMPPDGYAPYRAWGRLPAGLPARLCGWLLGPRNSLLYIGITSRAGFVRWVEESDTWRWARDVSCVQRDEAIRWPTLHDAVVDRAGRIVLVVDDDQDDGARPARPDEHLVDAGQVRFRGELVDAYQVRADGAPARAYGQVIEGARTGERRMIHAEAPVHNIEHNEGNPRAANRRRRVMPRHLALWRRQAVHLAAGWLAVAVLMGWEAYDGGGVAGAAAGVPAAVSGSAVLVLSAQLVLRAHRGRANVVLQRRRARGFRLGRWRLRR